MVSLAGVDDPSLTAGPTAIKPASHFGDAWTATGELCPCNSIEPMTAEEGRWWVYAHNVELPQGRRGRQSKDNNNNPKNELEGPTTARRAVFNGTPQFFLT